MIIIILLLIIIIVYYYYDVSGVPVVWAIRIQFIPQLIIIFSIWKTVETSQLILRSSQSIARIRIITNYNHYYHPGGIIIKKITFF